MGSQRVRHDFLDLLFLSDFWIFPIAQTVKNLPAMQETGFNPWVGKIPCRRERQPTPVLLPEESHGQRTLVGHSQWGRRVGHDWATNTTEKNTITCDASYLAIQSVHFSPVTQFCLTLCEPVDCSTPGFPFHHQLLKLAQTHVHWAGDAILPSQVIPFSSCLQSCPASGSFPMSQFFASGGQSIGVSASASILPMNIQDWFPLGWTGSSQVNILCLISATYWVLVTFQKSQLKANVKETKQKDNRRIISPAFSFY